MRRSRAGEAAHQRVEHDLGLGLGERAVLLAQQVAERRRAVRDPGVQRGGREAPVRGERLHDVGRVLAEVGGDLAGSGRSAEPRLELLLGRGDAGLEVLHPPGRTHHPSRVAEVSAQLTADGGHGERQEVVTGVGVEALRGLGQPEQRHLLEVVEVDAAVAVAGGHAAGHGRVGLDELTGQLVGVGLAADVTEVADDGVGATGTCLALEGRASGRMAGLDGGGSRGAYRGDSHGNHGSLPGVDGACRGLQQDDQVPPSHGLDQSDSRKAKPPLRTGDGATSVLGSRRRPGGSPRRTCPG